MITGLINCIPPRPFQNFWIRHCYRVNSEDAKLTGRDAPELVLVDPSLQKLYSKYY